MKKNACAVSILAVALFLSFILVSFDGSVSARSQGVNFIRTDGAVVGTSNIQRYGDVYTFTGNVTGSLTVEKDDVVIDGAGFTLEGGNRGIILEQRQNVTVKNTRITLEGGYVFDLTNASYCTIIGNSLIGTPQPIPGLPLSQPPARLIGPIGLKFLFSMNNTIKNNNMTNGFYAFSMQSSEKNVIIGNNITDSVVGFDIQNAQGNILRNNRVDNCSQGISVRTYSGYNFDNDVDASNTVDGKPIYYWLNLNVGTVPSDAAYVALVNCTNITVQNSSPTGIALASTTNSTIANVTMTGRGDGITLLDCSGISILDCDLHDGAIAMGIENSSNNTISGNDISNSLTRGINLGNATNIIISGNNIFNNSYAIAPFQDTTSKGNIIASNNFTDNGYAITVQGNMQIHNNTFVGNEQAVLCYSGSNTITGNTFTGNNYGVFLYSSSSNTLTQNNFTYNQNALYFSSASNNNIYLNNFQNNTRQVYDNGMNNPYASVVSATLSRQSTGARFQTLAHVSVEPANFIGPLPLSANNWDNGAKGNYWSDYNGTDANGDGIGDTAFYLYGNNQDIYPLMSHSNRSAQLPYPSPSPSPSPSIPEFPAGIILPLPAVASACFLIFRKRLQRK